MPGGDRTGPMGNGPMTGRAAGFCAGSGAPGSMNWGAGGGQGFGRGMGPGFRGRGRGYRNRFWATGLPGWGRFGAAPAWGAVPNPPAMGAPTQHEELELLKQQAQYFAQSLDDIRKRIDELGAETTGESKK